MKIPFSDLVKEFRAFAFKGNLLDLAVAVIIGTAFGKVVDSFVKNIMLPLINMLVRAITGSDKPASYQQEWTWGGVQVGVFVGEILNFLIVAAAVFIMVVKILGYLVKRASAAPAEGPVVRECPFCISEIPIKATRCKFCTSEIRAAKT
jgi:large conductance mechanosensitive channel